MKMFFNASAVFALLLFMLVACNTNNNGSEHFEELKADESVESSKVQKVLLNVQSKEDAAYLGLKNTGDFRIDDINAKAVIIYVMSSVCPTCLESVEGMNELYDEINVRKSDIKIIVINTGDTEKAASAFRDKTTFHFPVFADPDGQIAKILEVDSVPHMIAVIRDEDNSYNIIFDHYLIMDDPDGFLDFLIKNM